MRKTESGTYTNKSIKRKTFNKTAFEDNFELLLLALPGIILTFIFCYLPMGGIIIAFKNFNPNLGILASKWVGFDNFKFFFTSNDFFRIMRNTLGYSITFLFLDNVVAIALAIMLYNVQKRAAIKYYQTTMILPNFMSMVLVAYVVYAILNPTSGILNSILSLFAGEKVSIQWYGKPGYWPFILTIVQIWKSVGMKTIIYYAALMGIDEALFEAARIDGATQKDEIRYIIIPELGSIICIYLIMGVGGLVGGDFGLFYQVPMNIGVLYPTTDIISTYVFRALQDGTNMGRTAAVGLFQSVTGTILVIISNAVVKKIDPDKSMF